jgi:tetrahydromethanopterin S-methyltransferase subunit G
LIKDIKEEFKMIYCKMEEINDKLEDIKEHYPEPLPIKAGSEEYNLNDVKEYEAMTGLFSIISDLIKEIDEMKDKLDDVEYKVDNVL